MDSGYGTQAVRLARQTWLPAEPPHLTYSVFLISENIITKREDVDLLYLIYSNPK